MQQSQQHANARAGKAQVPIHFLREPPRDEGPNERAEVNAHIENGKPRVPSRVGRFIQRSDDAADVGLQQPGADHDEREAGIEEGERVKREGEVSERDDDPAEEDAAVLAQPAVGNDSAEDWSRPGSHRVVPIDRAGVRVVKSEPMHHIQDEERPHSVITEALPHLGEEKGGEAAWVARPT